MGMFRPCLLRMLRSLSRHLELFSIIIVESSSEICLLGVNWSSYNIMERAKISSPLKYQIRRFKIHSHQAHPTRTETPLYSIKATVLLISPTVNQLLSPMSLKIST